jgi:hypothetical protein
MAFTEPVRPRSIPTRRRAGRAAYAALVAASAALVPAFAPARAAAEPAAPSVEPVTVDRLAVTLSAIEAVPSAAELRAAFGASTAPALVAVTEDRERPAFVRARALSALADVDPGACGPAAARVLTELESPRALLRAAAASWIRAAPDAIAAWGALTDHPLDLVRELAARGLAARMARRPELRAELEALRRFDPSLRVRETAAELLGVER